jgi:hypothetical protein
MNPEEEANKLAEKYDVTFKPGEFKKYAEERRIRRENVEKEAIKRKAELLGQPRLESQNKEPVSSGVREPGKGVRGANVLVAMYDRFTQKKGGKRSKKSKRRISRRNRNKRRTHRH